MGKTTNFNKEIKALYEEHIKLKQVHSEQEIRSRLKEFPYKNREEKRRQAADIILQEFHWASTKEGHLFWQHVYRSLICKNEDEEERLNGSAIRKLFRAMKIISSKF